MHRISVSLHGLSLVALSRGYFSLWSTGFSLGRLLSLWSTGPGVQGLESVGSVVAVQWLGCPVTSGIFREQRSNICPLHWQADSYSLYHQGSP